MALPMIKTADADGGLLLLGITHAALADVMGQSGADFAGMRVRPIVEGPVAAIVCAISRPSSWIAAVRERMSPKFSFAPVLSAVSSILPIVPVQPDCAFKTEEVIRKLLAGRADELDELVLRHSAFLECDLTARFDRSAAEADLMESAPVGALKATSLPEFALVQQTLAQSVTGRRASFVARLRRILNEIAADMIVGEAGEDGARLTRRVLIARSMRKEFRQRIGALAAEVEAGARLSLGWFMPPLSFRRLEIRGANAADVGAARAALGVDDGADRKTIRVAYRRSIERLAPSGGTHDERLDRLGAHFGLLDLVAEGQIRASRQPAAPVRFDERSLAETWLIKLHVHNVADRVA